MKLETVVQANREVFPQFTITKVVDTGDFCVVFVCCDDGYPPFQMPYKVEVDGTVSSYNMFSDEARTVVETGKVIYLDETPLRDRPLETNTAGPTNDAKADGSASSPADDLKAGVGVLVVQAGRLLIGKRTTQNGYGLFSGPGGHIKAGEQPAQAAFRETEEEFGISANELLPLGRGPAEPETGIRSHVFLCTDYNGEPNCVDGEMTEPRMVTLETLELLKPSLFQPFADGVELLKSAIAGEEAPDGFVLYATDGGAGSGNFGHEGRPGEIGGSAPDGSADSKKSTEKTTKLKEGFKHLKPNQKYAYISRSGIVPKGELESLKEGIRTGDQASMDKLAEYEQMYFDSAEYGRTVKSLDVEMRDEVAAMSDADAAAWAQKSMDRQLESHEGWANQYSAAQKVAIDMAVCETPQVVSREDFDKYVKDSGAVVCYRGVKDIDSMTGENMQFQMAYNTQEPYFGDGIFGDGLYFSTRKDTAESYAGRAEISTCAVRPDAKILEYGSPEHDKAKKRVQTTDDSVAALCSGYDVIHKKQGSNEDYYVILNRAALVMVDPVDDLADVALKASERNAARGDEKTVDSEEKTLDFSTPADTIKSKGTSEDGGPGSGNHGHKGVPGQVGGSLPATTTEALKEAIATGSVSTKLSRSKQSKHKKGTTKYNNAIAKGNHVSYMTVDDDEIESIVKTKAGTGKPYGGGQHFKETVDVGKPVGFYLNERGEEKETTRVTIHYGSKDCHVVPASPKKG